MTCFYITNIRYVLLNAIWFIDPGDFIFTAWGNQISRGDNRWVQPHQKSMIV